MLKLVGGETFKEVVNQRIKEHKSLQEKRCVKAQHILFLISTYIDNYDLMTAEEIDQKLRIGPT